MSHVVSNLYAASVIVWVLYICFEQLPRRRLFSFSGPFKSSYNIICAGVLLTLIPSLIVFLLFQKQVYAGLASGSVKG